MKLKNIYLHYTGVLIHKFLVLLYMARVALKIIIKGVRHDNSKLTLTEGIGFIKIIDKFKSVSYNSKKYNYYLKLIKPYIKIHYKRNAHHPEHYNSFNKMNIYDLIEMICDWKASIKKNKNGNLNKSFKINKKRFNIDKRIMKILKEI